MRLFVFPLPHTGAYLSMPIPDPPLRFQPLPNETGRDSVNGRLDSATSTAMPERRATTAQRGPSKIESLRKATILMLTPEKRIGEPPGSIAGLKAIILSSWLNLLLVFIPISVSISTLSPLRNANFEKS